MRQAIIWCEITCSNCGWVIGFNYRNAETIAELKRKTKNWAYCDEEGNLCPQCYEKYKKRKISK